MEARLVGDYTVSNIDAAKAFYVDKVGFNADRSLQISDEIRFVPARRRATACSITMALASPRRRGGRPRAGRWW